MINLLCSTCLAAIFHFEPPQYQCNRHFMKRYTMDIKADGINLGQFQTHYDCFRIPPITTIKQVCIRYKTYDYITGKESVFSEFTCWSKEKE